MNIPNDILLLPWSLIFNLKSPQFSTKINKLWKDVEIFSRYHTQKRLLDAPNFIADSTIRHLLFWCIPKQQQKKAYQADIFWVWYQDTFSTSFHSSVIFIVLM